MMSLKDSEKRKAFRCDCPLCGTKRVSFEIKSTWLADRSEHTNQNYQIIYRHVWDSFAICGICNQGIIAVFMADITGGYYYEWGEVSTLVELPNDSRVRLVQVRPEPSMIDVPSYTPENAKLDFLEAADNLQEGKFRSAGIMFRRALEIALDQEFPKVKGNLDGRIKKLREQGDLPETMADWAERIRLLGNSATHKQDPFTEKNVNDIYMFIDLLFRYLFTLPGTIAEYRKKEDQGVE